MRNRISGRVIDAESGVPLRDLVVVVYDVDLGNQPSELPPAASGSLSAYYLYLLYGVADTEEDPALKPLQPAADRLGSVVTGPDGWFTLSFDDSGFRVRDAEERPDLLVAVLAPDLSAASSVPWGTAEYRRLLHLSFHPTRNAGREENVIIRIPEANLTRHGLSPSQGSQASSLIANLARRASRSQATRAQLKELSVQQLQRHAENRDKAERFARNVSAVPAGLRSSPFFVGPGRTPEQVLGRAREEGTERLRSEPVEGGASLSLDPARLGRLAEDPFDEDEFWAALDGLDPGQSHEQKLKVREFCSFLDEKRGGAELQRVLSDLRSVQAGRRRQRGRIPPPEPGPARPEDARPGEPAPAAESLEEEIKRLAMERVRGMSATRPDAEVEPEAEAAPTQQSARISDSFDRLKPPASPADVTAFHDFHHLQIAFPDVWAEAFDGDVSTIIEKLNIEYREHDEELGGVLDLDRLDPDSDSLHDVREYTELLGRLVGEIRSTESRPIPAPVYGLMQEIFDDFVDLDGKWGALSLEQQEQLLEIATDQVMEEQETHSAGIAGEFRDRLQQLLEHAREKNSPDFLNAAVGLLREVKQTTERRLVPISSEEKRRRARALLENPQGRVTRGQRLLTEMAGRLDEPHSFRIFAHNSYNFGILNTYRQEWRPGDYQVGSLVATLPLAPGESRKYTKKQVLKRSRRQKEHERHAATVADERTFTSRASADIIEKASSATNFSQTFETQFGGRLLGFDITGSTSTEFQRNQAAESERVKKAFREAVRKSSQEYKNEREIEITTEDISEFEATSASEVSNPNNEITVTYLFYELERQFRVTERLQRLTPVVLVAQSVPNPADIDEDWLLAHEWILRRSLLDSSFAEALDYIAEGLMGDEVGLELRRDQFETQKGLVEDLSDTVSSLTSLQETLRETMIQTSEREKIARARRKRRRRRRILRAVFTGGLSLRAERIASGISSLAFGNRNESPETLEARREALETRLEFLEGTLENAREALNQASSGLEQATAELSAAIKDSFTKRNLVNQLRIHVKANILHYMQAVWSAEKADQRFFRLYDLPVEIPVPGRSSPDGSVEPDEAPPFRIRRGDSETSTVIRSPLLAIPGLDPDSLPPVLRVVLPPPSLATVGRRLHQIADLDHLIGFKGNYMIFPLKECTYITDYMMQDYIDDYFGIRDPDPAGDFTTDELLDYAEAVWHAEETTPDMQAALRDLIHKRLTSPRIENELVVIPTGQLFVEALKGEHALLEHFKERHRREDVRKVREEVRQAELENLRRAARLIAGEREDPEVERTILLEGRDVDVDLDLDT